MSQSHFCCSNCPGRHFSTLLQAVEHVMSERGTQKGSRGVHVKCCVRGCFKSVRKLRLHIRKSHGELCRYSCSDCHANFVGQNDLNNHHRNGCPRRKQTEMITAAVSSSTFWKRYTNSSIGTIPSNRPSTGVNFLSLWSLSRSDSHAKFVGQSDLDNHYRNESSQRKQTEMMAVAVPSSTVCERQSQLIETFFENVDFGCSSSVNNFISNTLQLDEASRKAVSAVVDLVYKHLQHNLSSLSINKLVKGGSVGKGTAVKDKADIDCVVFFNDVKTMEEHKLKLQQTKDSLESCLKHSSHRITFGKQTPYAVKFRLNSSQEFNIDLLPTFTTDQSLEQLYNEMIGCKTKDKGYYSAGLVSYQMDFVKGQPAIVKDLIRLVKYWRKTCIQDTGETRLPASYPLELITIDCWEKAGKPNSFDIRAGFKAVLQQLVDNCRINVRWDNYYSKTLAERGIKGMSRSQPFVLDPANPTNNVCSASDAEGWKIVADVAKMTLEKQPLKYTRINTNWQI